MAKTPLPSSEPDPSSYAHSADSSPRSRGTDWDPYRWDDTVQPAPPANGAAGRLRLMCSYGGRIVPRPHDKALCYVGGETRMVVVDRHLSLSDLSARLSRLLSPNHRFSLKYQLPTEDLDSLISVSNDEDLENMIEEYDRCLAASPRPSRIRLFLFPPKSEVTASSGLAESWFVDALNEASNGGGFSDSRATSVDCLLGLESDDSHHGGFSMVAASGKAARAELQMVPDSPRMDTTSSYGSTSSALSVSNLPPIRVRSEEQAADTRVSPGLTGVEEQFAQLTLTPESVKTPRRVESPGRDNLPHIAKSVYYQEPSRFPAAPVANPTMTETKSELPDQNYKVHQMQYPSDLTFIVQPEYHQYVHHQTTAIPPPPLPSFYHPHPEQHVPPQHVDPTTMPAYFLPYQVPAMAAMRPNQAFHLAAYQSSVADPSGKPVPMKDQFSILSYAPQLLPSAAHLPRRPDFANRTIPVPPPPRIHDSEPHQFTRYRHPLNPPNPAYDYRGPSPHVPQYYTQPLQANASSSPFPAVVAVETSSHLSADSKQTGS